MLPTSIVQWHAALNDFPAILLLLSFTFDIAGEVTKRASLKAAGFWTLVTAGVGVLAALASGLQSEKAIDQGAGVQMVMERHETLAIAVTILIVLLTAWRIWRKGELGPRERPSYLTIVGIGVLFTLWTAHLGGTIVYQYGGGIPTAVMRDAIDSRATGHVREPGEEHDDDVPAEGGGEIGTSEESDHTPPPGTPAHDD